MRGFRAQHPQADENQSWGHATTVLQVARLHTHAPTRIAEEDTQVNVIIKWRRYEHKPDD